MKVNATEEELRDIAEVLKFAAILDDNAPHSDSARIAAWGEQIHRYQLIRTDLLDGLQAFYDNPRDRPIAIGDLIHHARIIKRGRLERAAEAQEAARAALGDSKAADDVFTAASLTARLRKPAKSTPRLDAARDALQTCEGKAESRAAIAEYQAALREANRPKSHAPERPAHA